MFQIYLLIFWIPAIVSAIMLWIAWSNDIVRYRGLVLVWFAAALFLQVLAGLFSPVWAVALVLQVALALYLSFRVKLGL